MPLTITVMQAPAFIWAGLGRKRARPVPARAVNGAGFLVLAWVAMTAAFAQSFTFVSAFTEDVGRPTGLTLDMMDGVTFLYVSDHDGGRVFRYNLADGSRVQIASRGTANGQFLWPDAIAVEPATHDLYIADRQLHRVTRLTRNGAFVMKWGDTGTQTNRFGHPGAGTAPGQFNAPVGVVLDAAGNIYTTEHENHRVQKFRVTQNAGIWNVETLTTWGSGGSAPGQFNTPYGIAVDAAGNIWVADGFNSRLQKFTPNGELLGQIVVRGPTEPHLVNTWVTFDAAGALYVGITSDPNTGGDIANQRIEKFNPAGASLGKWGSYGGGPGQFRLPFGIVIHQATNRAYVTDYDNNRIQIFDLGTPTAPPPPTPPAPPRRRAARDSSISPRANASRPAIRLAARWPDSSSRAARRGKCSCAPSGRDSRVSASRTRSPIPSCRFSTPARAWSRRMTIGTPRLKSVRRRNASARFTSPPAAATPPCSRRLLPEPTPHKSRRRVVAVSCCSKYMMSSPPLQSRQKNS